jgi:hypothetical protein
MSDKATRELEVRTILTHRCGQSLSPDLIDKLCEEFNAAMDSGPCAWAFNNAQLRADLAAREEDCITMTFRLMGEDVDSFSPETREAFLRWQPKAWERLGGKPEDNTWIK